MSVYFVYISHTLSFSSQLTDQYGVDVASLIMARSRSNLQLAAMPTMPYSSNHSRTESSSKYNSVGTRAPEGATE